MSTVTYYDGRILGPYAAATREKILDALACALACTRYHEISVMAFMGTIGKSPAVFYQYFPNLRAALFALAAEITDAGGDLPPHLELIVEFFNTEEALLASGEGTDGQAQ